MSNWFDCYSIWKYSKTFVANGFAFTLHGHSISARSSGFWIPQLKLMLDAGIQSPFSPHYIFISHNHSDHSFALPMIVKNISSVPEIYVPEGTVDYCQNFINSVEILTCDGRTTAREKEEEFYLKEFMEPVFIKNKNITVLKLKTYHTVKSNGFVFIETRKRLQPQYSNLDKDALISLKRENVEITESYQVPLFVYTGDTDIRAFEDACFDQYEFPFIITECTFVGDLESSEEDRIQVFDILGYIG